MKFDATIEISVPIDQVVAHFVRRDNQLKWHPELKSVRVIKGVACEVGCQTLLKFNNFEILETVVENHLPDSFLGDYDTAGICRNTMKNEFTPVGTKTLYRVTVDYTQMNWMMKCMSVLMPWALKGQVKKYMKKFKRVVETENERTSKAGEG